jgi:hypothetical protein
MPLLINHDSDQSPRLFIHVISDQTIQMINQLTSHPGTRLGGVSL